MCLGAQNGRDHFCVGDECIAVLGLQTGKASRVRSPYPSSPAIRRFVIVETNTLKLTDHQCDIGEVVHSKGREPDGLPFGGQCVVDRGKRLLIESQSFSDDGHQGRVFGIFVADDEVKPVSNIGVPI